MLKMNAMAWQQYLCIDQRSTEWPRGFFLILQVPVEKEISVASDFNSVPFY